MPKSKSVIVKPEKIAALKDINVKDISCGPSQMGIIDYNNDLYMLGRQLNNVWQHPTKIMSNVE